MNNVGRSHSYPSDFVDTTEEDVDNILTININSTLKFTHMVLAGMTKRYASSVYAIKDLSDLPIVSF